VSRYQKGKTNLDFTEARDSEWQWHQLGHMQVCTSLQTDNDASNPPLSFYRPRRCPSCRPSNSVKAPKATEFVGRWNHWSLCDDRPTVTFLVARHHRPPLCRAVAGCGGRLSSSTDGMITSPGFPTSLYDASSNCTWIITASRPGVRPLGLVLTKLLVLIYYDGKQCLDRVVCILLVSFNILILSVFFFISIGLQWMHVFVFY